MVAEPGAAAEDTQAAIAVTGDGSPWGPLQQPVFAPPHVPGQCGTRKEGQEWADTVGLGCPLRWCPGCGLREETKNTCPRGDFFGGLGPPRSGSVVTAHLLQPRQWLLQG